MTRLAEADVALHARLMAARAEPDKLAARDEAALVIDLGPPLEAFLGELFGIGAELETVRSATRALDPIHTCKRLFVQRQAVKKYADPTAFDGAALSAELEAHMGEKLTELSFAHHVLIWESAGSADALDLAMRYAAWAALTAEGQALHHGGTLFRVPHRVDPMHLVPVETIERDGVTMLRLPEAHWRERDGFSLTDAGMSTLLALVQMNYCIWCHEQS